MIALIFSFLLNKIICYKALLFSIYDVKRYPELLIDTCNRVLNHSEQYSIKLNQYVD